MMKAKVYPTLIVLLLLCLLPVACSTRTPGDEETTTCYAQVSPLTRYANVTDMCEDHLGYLWISTLGNGLFRYDGANYVQYMPSDAPGSIHSSTVNTLCTDSQGCLWIGTQRGINKYVAQSNSFENYPIDENWNYIVKLFEDASQRLFATTRRGLFLFNSAAGVFHKVISFENTNTPNIFVAPDGTLWLTNDYSIDHYDTNFSFIKSYPSDVPLIQTAFDGRSNIYIASHSKLTMFDIDQKRFVPLPHKVADIDTSQLSLLSSLGNGEIAIVTHNRHFYYNAATDSLATEQNYEFPYEFIDKPTGAKFVFKDSNHNIWMGTNSKGILKLSPNRREGNPYYILTEYLDGKNTKDLTTDGRFIYVVTDEHNLVLYHIGKKTIETIHLGSLIGLPIGDNKLCNIHWDDCGKRLLISVDNNVYDYRVSDEGKLEHQRTYTGNFISSYMYATADLQGGIWAGGMNSVLQHTPAATSDEAVVTFGDFETNPGTTQVHVSDITTLRSGEVVVAYTDIGIVIIDPQVKTYKHVKLSDKYKQMYIQSVCEDDEGNLWIGASDIGLFRYNRHSDEVVHFEQFEGKYVGSIVKGEDNRMLMIVESTLFGYDPTTESFVPLWANVNENCGYGGQICLLPHNKGIIEINRRFRLIDFALMGDEAAAPQFGIVVADNNSSVIAIKEWDDIKDKKAAISLPTHQNNLNLYLSAIDYNDNSFRNYQYRMDGIATEWKDLFGTHIPLYNLPYGKHTLYLRAKSPEGKNATEAISLTIGISYPWYLHPLAKMVYVVALLAVLLIILNLIRLKNKKKIEAEIANREKLMQEKQNKSNLDFFANISHEFRTPLTIISGAAGTMCRDESLSPQQSYLPSIVQRNADRMLKMVGQLMDFNKLDHNKLSLSVACTEINRLLTDIVEIFYVGAKEKGIRMTIHPCQEPTEVWVDMDKFEKVIYNVLSNALKFTPPGGEIAVCAEVQTDEEVARRFGKSAVATGGYVTTTISDTGIGIPQEKLEVVFERFAQVNPNSKIGGTGIGLYFTKSLVEAHRGFIKAENRSNGNGTCFVIALPMEATAYTEQERAGNLECAATLPHAPSTLVLPAEDGDETNPNHNSLATVLIIDDDYEIINYLRYILSQRYRVVSSLEATTGYQLIESEHPDVIISDIMMNGMDGIELCQQVKENIATCHIPFILLTAKATISDQIEGLNTGADAYIVKPFDPDYLFAAIGSLLQNREHVRQQFGKTTQPSEVKEGISARDKELMEQLYQLMEEELTNPEINITKISEQLGISRTKLYYKIKGLTGKTPNDFFKIYKLNRSVDLLKEDKYKIAVIADLVGFSSPSHFAASFKKHFGVLPSRYFDKKPLN